MKIRSLAKLQEKNIVEELKVLNKNEKSIHETEFPKIPSPWADKELEKKWRELYQIKQT